MALLWDDSLAAAAGPLAVGRAKKLANFFAQPFFCAEPWTKRPGSFVSAREALQICAEILDGAHDDLSVKAFHFTGGIAEIRAEGRS